MSAREFQLTTDPDVTLLQDVIGEAIGAAGMAWEFYEENDPHGGDLIARGDYDLDFAITICKFLEAYITERYVPRVSVGLGEHS